MSRVESWETWDVVQEMKISLSCSCSCSWLEGSYPLNLLYNFQRKFHGVQRLASTHMLFVPEILWLNYLFIDSKSFSHFWQCFDTTFEYYSSEWTRNLNRPEKYFQFIILSVNKYTLKLKTLFHEESTIETRREFIEKFIFWINIFSATMFSFFWRIAVAQLQYAPSIPLHSRGIVVESFVNTLFMATSEKLKRMGKYLLINKSSWEFRNWNYCFLNFC